jgi:hypothetical protein
MTHGEKFTAENDNMGLDMWLPSVFDYNDERQVEAVTQPVLAKNDPDSFDGIGLITAMYDAYRATGGYYHEGYNGRGLLALMGLSWNDIMDDLPDRNVLPVDHARRLLDKLEARPITYAMVYGECRNDRDVQPMRVLEQAVGLDLTPEPQPDKRNYSGLEWGAVYGDYVVRRDELMTLLRTAIERNEALCISG